MVDRETHGPSPEATPPVVGAPRAAPSRSDSDEELDTEFQAEFEADLEHHHLWHLAGASPGSLLLRGLVLIPLGTVLAEELAFRGVLHGRSVRSLPVRAALGVSAVAFGLWHLTVALGPSAIPLPPTLQWTSALAVLAVTVAGGLALGWLRHRTGSVLAPIGLHLGTNAVGLVAAGVALAH